MTIIAAADGSAIGNPGPAGWGWFIDEGRWACGGWPHGTNNMGELMAVLDLLVQTAAIDEPVHILCDSQYVINSVTKWMPGWKRNGWKKKDGKPVLNVDLMRAIDEAMQGRRVTFEWVKGHAGHHLNERADELANGAARAYQAGREPFAGPGFVVAAGAGVSGAGGASDGLSSALPSDVRGGAADEVAASSRGSRSMSAAPAIEPDLFSLFDDLDASREPSGSDSGARESGSPFDEVVAAERALLSDEVRSDAERVAAYLHADWLEIGSSGRLYSRAEMLAEIAPLERAVTLEVVSAERIDANTILLVWRARRGGVGAGDDVLRSSVWVRSGARWLQRFHQGTRANS